MNLLITAGPTVEDIDPVRFISNRSSGKSSGVEIAAAAALAGCNVVLVHGPVGDNVAGRISRLNARVKAIPVRSAADMLHAVNAQYSRAHAVILSAAVADFTPAKFSADKIKKASQGLLLRLNPPSISRVNSDGAEVSVRGRC